MITTIIKGGQWLSMNSPRVHVSMSTFTVFGLHSRVYVCYSRFMSNFVYFCFAAFVTSCCIRDTARACVHACPCAYACVWSINILHLCSAKCIYMNRRLTFLFRLKPRRPDILLTVAGDILPLLPQEDYITPLLSPLISLSSILFIPPLLCPLPSFLFNISPLFPPVVITLKRKRGTKKRRWEPKHTRITNVRHFLEKDRTGEKMSRAKQGLRETKFQC